MLFDTFSELDRIGSALLSGFSAPAMATAPVDLRREDDRYLVEADLPGFDPASIDVSVEGRMLTIRAERTEESEDRSGRWLVRERRGAGILRRFDLGQEVDVDAISADYRDGVLRVTLPIVAEALPRKVQVAIGGAPTRQAITTGPGTAESNAEAADPKAAPAHSAVA